MTDKFQKKIFLFSIFTTNVMSSDLVVSDTKETKEEFDKCGGGETNEKKEEINSSLVKKDEEINNSNERLDTNESTDDEKEEEKNEETNEETNINSEKEKDKNKESELIEKSEKDKERIPSEEKDKENGKESRKGKENISKELYQIREKTKGKQNEQNGIPLHKFCSAI